LHHFPQGWSTYYVADQNAFAYSKGDETRWERPTLPVHHQVPIVSELIRVVQDTHGSHVRVIVVVPRPPPGLMESFLTGPFCIFFSFSSFFLLPSSFFLLPSFFFLLPSSFFLLPSSFFLLVLVLVLVLVVLLLVLVLLLPFFGQTNVFRHIVATPSMPCSMS
jgi:hypothetical protein